jgi:toxin FitB
MSYLLDTCVISEFVSKKPNLKVVTWLNSLDETRLYLSVVTIGEVQRGISKLPNSKRRQTLEDWLEHDLQLRFAGRILPLDTDILIRWGMLVGKLETEGKPMALFDSLIAATALHHDLRLITRNVKDFQAVAVKIDNPW